MKRNISLSARVLEFKLLVDVFDVFGQSIKNYGQMNFTAVSDSDIDRQLRAADARIGNYGFCNLYGRRYLDKYRRYVVGKSEKCRKQYDDIVANSDIVSKNAVLGYIIDILEPHNPSFKDNLGKAKALAKYAEEEPKIGCVQLIRREKDAFGKDKFKRLDMSHGSVR